LAALFLFMASFAGPRDREVSMETRATQTPESLFGESNMRRNFLRMIGASVALLTLRVT
jgi:hypothetical protein